MPQWLTAQQAPDRLHQQHPDMFVAMPVNAGLALVGTTAVFTGTFPKRNSRTNPATTLEGALKKYLTFNMFSCYKTDGPHYGTGHVMKAKFKSSLRTACLPFGGAIFVGAVLLLSTAAQAQDLFVADEGGNIYEFTPGGVRSTFASGFNNPFGLAFDRAGNLFVANLYGNSISEITPGGATSIFASGLNNPTDLAFDSAGNLFVSDWGTGNIYKFTPGGARSTFASLSSKPEGLAFDSAGNLYVANQQGVIYDTITKITPLGVQSTFAVGLNSPDGLAFDRVGDLFVANQGGNTITKITPTGATSTFASGLHNPQALAFDNAGDLFVSDLNSGNIYEFTPDGAAKSTFASGLPAAEGLAFQGVALPVPEPSALGLLAVSITALLIRRRKLAAQSSYKAIP